MSHSVMTIADFHPSITKVLVADVRRLNNSLIVGALQGDPRFDATACECRSDVFAASLRRIRPEIVLIGAGATGADESPIEMVRVGRSIIGTLAAIVLLDASDNSTAVDAFRAGARGVICRDEVVQSLIECILSVSSGQMWARKAHWQSVIEAFAASDRPRVLDHAGRSILTKREGEIVNGVVDGLSNRDIAVRLQLSESTVKNHLCRIFEKLRMANRTELVSFVWRERSCTTQVVVDEVDGDDSKELSA